jgi:hypothetical protein
VPARPQLPSTLRTLGGLLPCAFSPRTRYGWRANRNSEYEKYVAGLEGERFQDEVCARLQGHITDFQRIPDKPSGDGGLDGLSHGQEHAYCCYGPEQDPVKLKVKGLKDDIVEKFTDDLKKLFEVNIGPNRRVVHAANAELATIMGDGNKIRAIFLVVNRFETHRVIGALKTAFNRFKRGSQLNFVHADATLTIWGPKDLATRGPLDEHTLFRLQNKDLFDRLREATAADIPPNATGDSDAKFDDLKQRRWAAEAVRVQALALEHPYGRSTGGWPRDVTDVRRPQLASCAPVPDGLRFSRRGDVRGRCFRCGFQRHAIAPSVGFSVLSLTFGPNFLGDT